MNRPHPRLAAALPLLLALLLPSAPATAADLRDPSAKLRDTDGDTARAALTQLLAHGDRGRQTARLIIQALLEQRIRLHQTARKALIAPAAFLDRPDRIKPLVLALDRHAVAAAKAVHFAMDKSQYPIPAKAYTGWSPGRDYQKGQILLEARVEVAVGLFNKLEAVLVRSFGSSVAASPPGGGGFARDYLAGRLTDSPRPLGILKYDFTDATSAWSRIGATLIERHTAYRSADEALTLTHDLARRVGLPAKPNPPPLPPPPIVGALAALFAGQYADADKLRPNAALANRIFNLLVRRRVLIHNAKLPGNFSRSERHMLHQLNLYRLSLNLDPLVANPKLHAAAREHSQWQARNRRMTHRRPEPKLHRFGDRARAQGYPAARGENICAMPGPWAVWGWRSDAGHHRNLIDPAARAAGIGQSGSFVTYDTGGLIENTPLAKLLKTR